MQNALLYHSPLHETEGRKNISSGKRKYQTIAKKKNHPKPQPTKTTSPGWHWMKMMNGASFSLEATATDVWDAWKVRCQSFGPAWLLLPDPAEEERSGRAALSVLRHAIINHRFRSRALPPSGLIFLPSHALSY